MISIQWLNVTTNKRRAKKEQKRSSKGSPLVFTSVGELCWGERKAWGGGGIGREGVQVRERWRVGWIEEAERKTTVCGWKEGSDINHVFFCPQPLVPCCVFCTLTSLFKAIFTQK
jgi:hypothetical protein